MNQAISLFMSLALLVSGLVSKLHSVNALTSISVIQAHDTSKPFRNLVQMGSSLKDQSSDLVIKVSRAGVTNTLFMPAVVAPDCGDIAGTVIQDGRPLSTITVSLRINRANTLDPTSLYSTTTGTDGSFAMSCIPSTVQGVLSYTVEAYGNRDLGQLEKWSTHAFTLTRGGNRKLPPLTLDTLQLIDPISGVIQLSHTFVWTSTVAEATSFSLHFFGYGYGPTASTYILSNLQNDVFTRTITVGEPYQNSETPFSLCFSGCSASVRVFTLNGFGDSFGNYITLRALSLVP